MIVGQGPIALAVGAGGGCLDIFSLIYLRTFLSPCDMVFSKMFLNSVVNFDSLQSPCWCRYPKTVIVNNMF